MFMLYIVRVFHSKYERNISGKARNVEIDGKWAVGRKKLSALHTTFSTFLYSLKFQDFIKFSPEIWFRGQVTNKFEKMIISVGGLSEPKDGLKRFSTVWGLFCFLLANSKMRCMFLFFRSYTMYLRQRMAHDIKRNSKRRLMFAKMLAVVRQLSV